jgi:hypothetical protein
MVAQPQVIRLGRCCPVSGAMFRAWYLLLEADMYPAPTMVEYRGRVQ